MKKVLLITNYKPGVGGISGQVELLKNNLAKENLQADVFSTKGPPIARMKAFYRLCMVAGNYDVLHAHGCSDWGMLPIVYAVKVGKRFRKKVVVTYHGGGAEAFFGNHTRLVKRYLSKTDANIVLSGFLGKVFDKYGIPYTIIPNVIEFDASQYRKRDRIEPHFISLRSLNPLYNIECILRAFQKVKLQMPEATLTILSDGSSKESLEAFVHDNTIKDVTFVGRVPNAEIYNYLRQADIMLSAPRIDNMPVSLLEAFNAGLLVISSNVGGVPFMVEDKKTGLLFESDNYKELADKMIWAVEHQEATKAMVVNAKKELTKYSWTEVKKQLINIYLK